MAYVNQNGVLKNLNLSNRSMMQVLQITPYDVTDIFEKFRTWAGYYPDQSKRRSKDFSHFTKYVLANDMDLQLKAVFVLEIIMFRKVNPF